MPRLTNAEYLKRRLLVQAIYDDNSQVQALLGLLDIEKQQVLHYYYATGKRNLSDEELIAHRKWCDQSTTLKSGKAYAELYRIITRYMSILNVKYNPNDATSITKNIPALSKRIQKSKTAHARLNEARHKSNVRIMPIMRSEVDIEKLASALIRLAENMSSNKNTAL